MKTEPRASWVRIVIACMLGAPALAHDAQPTGAEVVKVVSAQKLPNVPGQSLTAVTVDVPPGDVSSPHHHAGFVFVYVLVGPVESKLNDEPSKRYATGESWVEPPGTLHASMSNPNKTETARILAVFVAPDGAELTRMTQ